MTSLLYGRRMVSVVLRLVPEELAKRRLVGEVEMVETGERRVLRDLEELLALLAQVAADAARMRRRPAAEAAAQPGISSRDP